MARYAFWDQCVVSWPPDPKVTQFFVISWLYWIHVMILKKMRFFCENYSQVSRLMVWYVFWGQVSQVFRPRRSLSFLCFSRELHSKVPEKKIFVANFPFLMDSPKLLHHMTKVFHWCSLFKKACSIVLCVGGAMSINVDCSPCVCVCCNKTSSCSHLPVWLFLHENSPMDNSIKASLMLSKLAHY